MLPYEFVWIFCCLKKYRMLIKYANAPIRHPMWTEYKGFNENHDLFKPNSNDFSLTIIYLPLSLPHKSNTNPHSPIFNLVHRYLFNTQKMKISTFWNGNWGIKISQHENHKTIAEKSSNNTKQYVRFNLENVGPEKSKFKLDCDYNFWWYTAVIIIVRNLEYTFFSFIFNGLFTVSTSPNIANVCCQALTAN